MSSHEIPNYQSGFTLLELIVYIVILAILSVVISTIFTTVLRGQSQVEVRSEVNANLRFGIEKISQDLRAASAVTTPATPGGTTADNLVMTTSEGTVRYCMAGNALRRQVNGTCDSNSTAITSTRVAVAAPTFTRLENPTGAPLNVTVVSINISLTISNAETGPEKTYSANKKTTVSLK